MYPEWSVILSPVTSRLAGVEEIRDAWEARRDNARLKVALAVLGEQYAEAAARLFEIGDLPVEA